MDQKPSVGRIVHFYTEDTTRQHNGRGKGPYAAMITDVGPGNSPYVNLLVFPPFTDARHEGSVEEVKPTPEGLSQARYWCWPPRV